ncbi:hypothetical protein B0T26DRAFT_678379 [Lasiosphaeria miniovina]|uniref:Uncharacterized protein n=1 Tax=Lasiosphaeria miniovina TaxID=1954250 RepID=A0AA40AE25_9PEZI|nr:uncharacterized protein B0T26DRAFT_678379 [Lasiosphaeria miniovina]KAK0714136.1 hypothetical protein B0T26DRAFT_678379 [Lasiosphaeria miniovina]
MGQILSLLACGGHDKHYGGTRGDRTQRRISRINTDRQEQRALRRQGREAGEELPEARRTRKRQERADEKKARQSAAAAEGHSPKRSGEHRSRRHSRHVSWHPGGQTGEQSSRSRRRSGHHGQSWICLLAPRPHPARDVITSEAALERFPTGLSALGRVPHLSMVQPAKGTHWLITTVGLTSPENGRLNFGIRDGEFTGGATGMHPGCSHDNLDDTTDTASPTLFAWQQVFAELVVPAVPTDEASSTLSQYPVRLGKHSAVDLGNPDIHAVCVTDGLLKDRGADPDIVVKGKRAVDVLLGGAKRYSQGAQERLAKYSALLRASGSGGETKTLVVCQSRRD